MKARKIAAGAALAIAVSMALTGCVASKLSDTISDSERASYEAQCNAVRGTFSGNLTWQVPTCEVIYTFPAIPDLDTVGN